METQELHFVVTATPQRRDGEIHEVIIEPKGLSYPLHRLLHRQVATRAVTLTCAMMRGKWSRAMSIYCTSMLGVTGRDRDKKQTKKKKKNNAIHGHARRANRRQNPIKVRADKNKRQPSHAPHTHI